MEHIILKDIIKFSKRVKGCKLKKQLLDSEEDFLSRIDDYFRTTRFQSLILVAVFELNSEDNYPDYAELATFLKCSAIELFVFKKEIEAMYDKGILENESRIVFSRINNTRFKISERVKNAIIENKPFSPPEPTKMTPIQIVVWVKDLIEARRLEDGNILDLRVEFRKIFMDYKETDFIKYLNGLKFNTKNLMAYLYVIAHNVQGNRDCELQRFSKGFFQDITDQLFYEKEILDKKNQLIKLDYFVLNDDSFYSSASVSLTERSSKELEPFKIPIRLKNQEKNVQLIYPNQVFKKKLFFDSVTDKEMDSITRSLKPIKYKKIINSLKSEGLRTGICTLFYGDPGTGKTEGVYQIAKASGRPMWKVELSELKSMWYGESQKLVKALFKNYEALCRKEKVTPILLLNEADAILGKRIAQNRSGVEKEDNAIQNIFLDCLENFEGILFATTNLEESLDEAFERRFLFKVRFNKPNKMSQSKIWNNGLHGISKTTSNYLATNFDLTGGEIENVIRKFKMARVLNPEIDIKEKLVQLCQSERFDERNQRTRIGFNF
ncbi:ATP-binding protein [Maribacter luteus]|uniref:ATP-binding protein n=1 Tax=Maribacter luteus TaxID=2594478 RepID=UPI0024928B83|nr:ATP-binding protein [Maribacter luteus]